MATTIYLIRHCSYQNPKEIMTFRLPGYALNSQGKQKAQKIGDFFKKNSQIAKIYSSPILRAKQTAQIIAKSLNLKAPINSLLIEVDSPFRGMSKKLYFQIEDVYSHPKHIKGGGESIRQIRDRMAKFIQKVLEENPSREVIAVSHGDPIMVCVDMITKGQIKEPLSKRKDYISMGEVFKLVFDENNKLESFNRINLS